MQVEAFFSDYSMVMSLILWAGFPLREMIKNKINQQQTSLDPRVLQIEYSRSEMDCLSLIPSISFLLLNIFLPRRLQSLLTFEGEMQLHANTPLWEKDVPWR